MSTRPLVFAAPPLLLVLLALAPGPGDARERRARAAREITAEGVYPAGSLGALPLGVPRRVRLLLPEGEGWGEALRGLYGERVRAAWPLERRYGALATGLPLWLHAPFVTARRRGRIVVPVRLDGRLPIRGRLEPPESAERWTVVLIDASQSANARIPGGRSKGARRASPPSVLEAERRALRALLARMPDDRRRIGVIAFGEGTWPIGPPGSSPRELETALAAFERDHPRGAGRTDTVCALFTAERWLRAAPRGARREILLLTDGDLPHSGRFTRCASTSAAVREACEARRNRSACPSAEALGTSSDLVQLAHFPRRTRRRVQVTPVVFDADRSLSTYRRLAEESGGRLVALPSADELDTALPTLLATRIDSVIAENLTTGERSPDLRLSDGERFAGAVQLAPGPNDVELRVETDEGTASRFRIRVHSARGELQSLLRDLRRRNAELSLRDQQLLADAPAPIPTRHLQITPD